MLETTIHEINMKRLLLDFFSDSILKKQLAFKGGTCLYFFYNLDRFSTDLDFNLIGDTLDFKKIENILAKYPNFKIIDKMIKTNRWFWSVSCGKESVNIKIEVSKRLYPDDYEVKNLLGINITVMKKDCMFSHKLCAISDRKVMQNRDLFDSLFMFKNNYPINEEIIKIRTGKNINDYFKFLIPFIQKNVNESKILDGLGEVLESSKKNYYKKHLLKDLLMELSLRVYVKEICY
jgi:predicted nucleotidyltransferase component of viral defense system